MGELKTRVVPGGPDGEPADVIQSLFILVREIAMGYARDQGRYMEPVVLVGPELWLQLRRDMGAEPWHSLVSYRADPTELPHRPVMLMASFGGKSARVMPVDSLLPRQVMVLADTGNEFLL